MHDLALDDVSMPETHASLSLFLLSLSEMTTGRALGTTQAKLWLSRAHPGTCNFTNYGDGGDCIAGDQGNFALPTSLKQGQRGQRLWEPFVSACLARCESCARCSFISVSPIFFDCSWFHSCPVAALINAPSGYLSGPTDSGSPTQSQWQPGARPAVFVHATDDRPTPALEESTDDAVWLAMGVVTAPNFTAAPGRSLFRHQSPASRRDGSPRIAWQYVVTDAQHRRDSRFAVVPCRDGPKFNSQTVLTCKVHYWFLHALRHFPAAKFIGKMEDDTVVHDARLIVELQHAYARNPGGRIWYAFFMWTQASPHQAPARAPTTYSGTIMGPPHDARRPPTPAPLPPPSAHTRASSYCTHGMRHLVVPPVQLYGDSHDDGFCGDGDQHLLHAAPKCSAPRPLREANWTSDRVIHPKWFHFASREKSSSSSVRTPGTHVWRARTLSCLAHTLPRAVSAGGSLHDGWCWVAWCCPDSADRQAGEALSGAPTLHMHCAMRYLRYSCTA